MQFYWNYDNDAFLSYIEGGDLVETEFFNMCDWEFIRHCYKDIAEQKDTEYDTKQIRFKDDTVFLVCEAGSKGLDRLSCLQMFLELYDVMIIGANDDHHSVRYEPWWQDFTLSRLQLEKTLLIEDELEEMDA